MDKNCRQNADENHSLVVGVDNVASELFCVIKEHAWYFKPMSARLLIAARHFTYIHNIANYLKAGNKIPPKLRLDI